MTWFARAWFPSSWFSRWFGGIRTATRIEFLLSVEWRPRYGIAIDSARTVPPIVTMQHASSFVVEWFPQAPFAVRSDAVFPPTVTYSEASGIMVASRAATEGLVNSLPSLEVLPDD